MTPGLNQKEVKKYIFTSDDLPYILSTVTIIFGNGEDSVQLI